MFYHGPDHCAVSALVFTKNNLLNIYRYKNYRDSPPKDHPLLNQPLFKINPLTALTVYWHSFGTDYVIQHFFLAS